MEARIESTSPPGLPLFVPGPLIRIVMKMLLNKVKKEADLGPFGSKFERQKSNTVNDLNRLKEEIEARERNAKIFVAEIGAFGLVEVDVPPMWKRDP